MNEATSHMNVGSTRLQQAPDLEGRLEYPIMQQASKLPVLTQLEQPDEAKVIQAHKDVGLKLSAGSMLHPKRVSRAMEKYNMQQRLLQLREVNYGVQEAAKDVRINELANRSPAVFMYDDVKMSPEEKLLSHYSEIKGSLAYLDAYAEDIHTHRAEDPAEQARLEARLRALADVRTFYEVYEALMLNKYYARVPRGEMMKLSEETLRVRLAKLYGEKPRKRNNELIDFYQNLLRLKQLGIKDGKSVEKKEEAYLKELLGEKPADDRDAASEVEKMVDTYKRMLGGFREKGRLMSEADREKRKAQFFAVYGRDIQRYQAHMTEGDAANLKATADDYLQNPGLVYNGGYTDSTVRGVLADNEETSPLERRKEAPYGISLTDTQKEGIRIVQTFLMRRASQESGAKGSFVYNLIQAPPEQQLTAFYLVETGRQTKGIGADFYSALQGYVPDLSVFRKKVKKHFWGGTDWSVITDAVQAAKGLGKDMEHFAELSADIEESERQLEAASQDPGKYKDQGRHAVEAMSYHAASLKQLYRLSGLHPDMPPDLVSDPVLRERMYTEYRRIGELAGVLSGIIKDHPQVTATVVNYSKDGVKSEEKEPETKSAMQSTTEYFKTANSYIGRAKDVDTVGSNIASQLSDAAKAFTEKNAIYNVGKNATLGLSSVLALVNAIYGIKVFVNTKNMTLVDELTQATAVSNSLLGSAGLASNSLLKVLKATGAVEATSSSVVTAGAAISGVCILTGTVGTAVEAVKLGRAVSSGHDVARAKEKLKERTAWREKTDEEKMLMRYLKHEERMTGMKKTSAAVNMLMNGAATAGFAMAATGVLLPVAAGLSAVAGIASFFNTLFYERLNKRENIEKAVDDYLGVEKMVEEMKKLPEIRAERLPDVKLKRQARNEALGQLGYTSCKQCYRDLCRQFANMLYRKVFCGESENRDEWNMYNDALSALGMKKVEYREDYGDNPQPSMQAILAKVMG